MINNEINNDGKEKVEFFNLIMRNWNKFSEDDKILLSKLMAGKCDANKLHLYMEKLNSL